MWGYPKEKTDQQAEKHHKAIQKLKEQQRNNMDKVHSMLLGLQSISSANPASSSPNFC